MWRVYGKDGFFRVAKETRGGLQFYMLSIEEPTIFYETFIKEEAFATAAYLNAPKPPVSKWELVEK